MITFKIFLRTDHLNSDGTHTVNLRLVSNRKKKDISLKIFVIARNWNPNSNRIRKTGKDFARKNRLITKYENRAKNIIDDYFLNDKSLTVTEFSKRFISDVHNDSSFYDYVLTKLENRKMAHQTYKAYKSQVTKLKGFRKELSFADISPDFIHKYRKYLIDEIGNNENTTNKSLRIIKAFINWAIEDELMKKNPFKTIKTKHVDGKREFLSILELEKLERLYNKGDLKNNLHNVLRYFLFACYTGLRYTDLQDLNFKHIKKASFNRTEIDMIDIKMHKTQKQVTIPLIKKAKDLLPTMVAANQKVFKIISNQKTNQNLKEVIKEAGISKKITFHSARHTLATNGLEMGIPIEVVSKILGHTELKTTQIYAKVMKIYYLNQQYVFQYLRQIN